MKVKDLIKELKKFDPDAIVGLSSDPEGNSFGTVDKGSFCEDKNDHGTLCIIFPWREHLEIEEISE